MADAITERIEELTDSTVREVIRDLNRRIIALEKGLPLEGSQLPSLEWTKEQLLEEADRRGIAVGSHATKQEILDALRAQP